MPETVITVVFSSSGTGLVAQKDLILGAIKAVGVDNLRQETLCPARAFDVILGTESRELTTALCARLSGFDGCDIFVQPNGPERKKKLFVADMDATMIVGETLDELAAHLGLQEKIAPITAAAMRGEIDFAQALRQRVKMLKGLSLGVMMEHLSTIRPSEGAKTLVRTMRGHGARCVLVSGGFDIFTQHVAGMLGFHADVGNRLEMQEDRATGEVVPPIVDKDMKKTVLEKEARALGIPSALAMAVGDGANDIPMLLAAGTGIGYFAKPAVQAATPHQIRYTDLTAILFMQGFRKEEIQSQ